MEQKNSKLKTEETHEKGCEMLRKFSWFVVILGLFTDRPHEIYAEQSHERESAQTTRKKLLELGIHDADINLIEAIAQVDVNGVRNALDAGAKPDVFYNLAIEGGRSWIGDIISVVDIKSVLPSEHQQAEQNCLEILRLLIEAGVKIRPNDHTALSRAIRGGFSRVVDMLIREGASPNPKTEGLTPVELAEKYGYREIVEILVNHGGRSISARDVSQLRFLHFAGENDIIEMEKALKGGARVNEGYRNVLPLALIQSLGTSWSESERYASVKYLLQKGANPNLQGPSTVKGIPGFPLHIAIFMTSVSFKYHRDGRETYAALTIEALLKEGADVFACGEDGRTPLHIAAKYNNLVGAKMLIEAGDKLMDRDKDGKTPLDYAESAEMIKLLKSHGDKEE